MAAPRPPTFSCVPDLSEVRWLLAERLASGQSQDALDFMVEILSRLQSENSQLALRLHAALRQLYGRRSEKVSSEQLTLRLATLSAEDQQAASGETASAVPASAVPEALLPDTTRKAAPHGRKPLPEAIVRLEVRTALEGAARLCPECQRERRPIGEERTELPLPSRSASSAPAVLLALTRASTCATSSPASPGAGLSVALGSCSLMPGPRSAASNWLHSPPALPDASASGGGCGLWRLTHNTMHAAASCS